MIDHSLLSGEADDCAAFFGADVSITNTPPQLAPFQQNAGRVSRFRAPLVGSGLIDAGHPDGGVPDDPLLACTGSDQNGVLRPLDGDADGEARCDLGAIEASTQTSTTFVVNVFDQDLVDETPGNGVCDTSNLMLGSQCTLRAAIMEANAKPGPDRIEFANVPDQTVVLDIGGGGGAATGDLDILDQVTIAGNVKNGWPVTTIDSATGDRIFDVALPAGHAARIEGLRLTGGDAQGALGHGGALRLNSESPVTLETIEIFGNHAAAGGGAVAVFGMTSELTIRNADLFENEADMQGSAIYVATMGDVVLDSSSVRRNVSGEAVASDQEAILLDNGGGLQLRNSTVSDHFLSVRGEGDFDLELRNSTFVNTTWGLQLSAGIAGASVTIVASLFESNSCDLGIPGGVSVDADHYNWGSTACVGAGGTNIASSIAFQNAAARVDGRVGRVVLLISPSNLAAGVNPILDAVPPDAYHCPALDQRGRPRPSDSDGNGQALCDIGAVEMSFEELQPRTMVVNVFDEDLVEDSPGDGYCDADDSQPGEQCTLRAAYVETFNQAGSPSVAGDIHIATPGVTITLTRPEAPGDNLPDDGDLYAGKPVRLRGPADAVGDARPLIRADSGDRILLIQDAESMPYSLENLRMAGGTTDLQGGAILVTNPDSGGEQPLRLHLTNVALYDNSANYGGAILADSTDTSAGIELLLDRVEVHGNTAESGAPALWLDTLVNTTITDSTVHGNAASLPGALDGAIRLAENSRLTLINSTISGNGGDAIGIQTNGQAEIVASTLASNAGFGIRIANDALGSVAIRHSAIADNMLGGCATFANPAAPLELDMIGHNLSQDGGCGMSGGSNLVAVDAMLGSLQQAAAGFTPYHAPLPGSPLIDGGSAIAADCPDTDQLGQTRPADGDGDGVALCDIGAIEAGSVEPPDETIFGDGFED